MIQLPENQPLVFTDEDAILNLSMDNGHTRKIFQITGREHLNPERRVKQALNHLYSGCAIRNLRTYRQNGGADYAQIVTMDYLVEENSSRTFENLDKLIEALDDNVVVWDSCDFYFDLEE